MFANLGAVWIVHSVSFVHWEFNLLALYIGSSLGSDALDELRDNPLIMTVVITLGPLTQLFCEYLSDKNIKIKDTFCVWLVNLEYIKNNWKAYNIKKHQILEIVRKNNQPKEDEQINSNLRKSDSSLSSTSSTSSSSAAEASNLRNNNQQREDGQSKNQNLRKSDSSLSSSTAEDYPEDAPLFGGDSIKLPNGQTIREIIFPLYEKAEPSDLLKIGILCLDDPIYNEHPYSLISQKYKQNLDQLVQSSDINETISKRINETKQIKNIEEASRMLKSWYQQDDLFSFKFESSIQNLIRKLVERVTQ
ncbi:hypothetical protein F8M41_015109 [Gigaspora margarita]|uniref:Uncharacterized protein n=1 Tax=Gigaspora margarita TaxID=4874 RepID=A0A8H3ZZJ1_GIGMA|nr:hypothetical protein F8M41_015109 [Gigaspora margarita]